MRCVIPSKVWMKVLMSYFFIIEPATANKRQNKQQSTIFVALPVRIKNASYSRISLKFKRGDRTLGKNLG